MLPVGDMRRGKGMVDKLVVAGGVLAGVLLALWFSTVVALGPAPGSMASGDKAKSNQRQEAARPKPSAVQKKTQPSVEETYCKESKNREECVIQLRTAIATESQAYYAFWAFLALLGTLVLSYGGTRAATRAAKAAEGALTDLERPHVFVEVVKAGLRTESDGSYSLAGARFEHKCVNYGRTPAALTEYHFEILAPKAGTFPVPIDPTLVRGRELPNGCVASERKPYVEGDRASLTYPVKLLDAGASETYSIFFLGYIRYRDMIFGARYISGFCFVYDWGGGKFVRRGDNERYNYNRIERAKTRPLADRLKEAAALLWGT